MSWITHQTWVDDYEHEGGTAFMEKKKRVLSIQIPEWSKQDCLIYLAPTTCERWFVWGEACTYSTGKSFDAVYDFVDGGAYFPTRETAMAEVFKWVRMLMDERLKLVEPKEVQDEI